MKEYQKYLSEEFNKGIEVRPYSFQEAVERAVDKAYSAFWEYMDSTKVDDVLAIDYAYQSFNQAADKAFGRVRNELSTLASKTKPDLGKRPA